MGAYLMTSLTFISRALLALALWWLFIPMLQS